MKRALLLAFAVLGVAAVARAQVFGGTVGGGATPVNSATVLGVVADAGTLPQAQRDVYANTFVAANMQPDGGSGRYFLISNTDGCLKAGAGSSTELCMENNTLTLNASSTIIPTAYIGQPACRASQSCGWYSDNWAPGVLPRSSLPACAAGQAGLEVQLSTDARRYICDGTTAQRVGWTLSATATVDFDEMLAGLEETATMTVTGATTTDAVHCSPLAAPESGLSMRWFRVSAANTVTLAARNASNDTLDPAAASWKCVVIR